VRFAGSTIIAIAIVAPDLRFAIKAAYDGREGFARGVTLVNPAPVSANGRRSPAGADAPMLAKMAKIAYPRPRL
jgi:hypothetical protein